jgi:vancomycin resistance protein YoaR
MRLVLGTSIPLLVIVLLLAAWAIDTSSASGKVPRNVTLADRDVSRLPEDDLAATVADVAEEYAAAEVAVRTADRTYTATAADLGLRLDEEATVADALGLDDDRSLPTKPIVWLGSFLDERIAPLTFEVDAAALESGLAELGGNAVPTEPTIVATADGFGIVSGSNGRSISPDGLAEQLVERAERGQLPLVIDARSIDDEPSVSDETAQELANTLTVGTANGLAVTAGDGTTTLPAPTVRAWMGAEVVDGQIQPTLDAERAIADLTTALPEPTEAKDASFTVEGGAVRLVPSTDGQRCCAADTPARLLAAVSGGTGAVEVALEVDEAEFSTEDAEKLGVREPVGTTTEWNGQPQVKSFTTYFEGGVPRAQNIRLIAETIRGTLVKPGEQFSINDIVGPRTTEKGYLEAGAIANGELVQDVGGGVSQFATTMFNAAFFAGLPIDTYQMHSQYFSRYPFGREATMGFPNPDLAWTNDTPYGILVWSTSTETSVTVTLYSTPYASGQQTGQTEGRSGNCTTVSTQRTITYVDGRTAQDSFNARYRDDGQTTC